MKNSTILLIIIIINFYSCFSQGRKFKVVTVAFYNLENLFDTANDPITFDDDRTPDGSDHWTEENYRDKLNNMATVISKIGKSVSGGPPALLGVAEVENRKVLDDLINQPQLASFNYGVVHYDSPDRRGIDVALLYRKEIFTPVRSSAHELEIYAYDDAAKRAYTRDQLLVKGVLDESEIYVIVNHWPSRSGGEELSSVRREAAAQLNRKIVDSILNQNPYAKLITMGDLNDDPTNKSVSQVLGAKQNRESLNEKDLYNPMYNMYLNGAGTLAYRDSWNLFDQIILSAPLIEKEYDDYTFYRAGIFNEPFVSSASGQYKGYPFRSYANGTYTGGYSDHYPVYIYLIKEVAGED
tara:strand:+ start:26352 stop:27410 length:1059 start_codon:yes stop_codon:yes gene_type:complete